MVRKTDDFTPRTNVRGGEGTMEMHPLLSGDEMSGRMTLCARMVMPPHTSIGYHPHPDDVEYYCILKGSGVFRGADGQPETVGAGDVCMIRKGESHGLENPFDAPLEMLAMVFE